MDSHNNLPEVRHSERDSVDLHSELSLEPLLLTQEKLDLLWRKAKEIPHLFDDFNRHDRNAFLDKFFLPTTIAFEVGDKGLIYFTDVDPPKNAYAHIIFWDKTLKDRQPYFREAAEIIFDKYGVHRITGIIPVFNRASILFARRVGCKIEGTLRDWVFSLGKWHDAVVLSLLRRDLDGSRESSVVVHAAEQSEASSDSVCVANDGSDTDSSS